MSSSIRLHSGVLFDPLNPDPSLITLEDVAYGLAGQFRYGGHSRMTVAQHAVLGSEMFGHTRDAFVFLHHDDSEGLGLLDIPSPIKRGMVKYEKAEKTLQCAVGKKFGIDLREFQSPSIHTIDKRMGDTERFHIFGRRDSDTVLLPIPLFPLWSPEEAERKYLERHHLLTSPQTFTTGEYARSVGMGRGAALARLTKLEERGIVERVKVKQNQGGIVRPNVLGWRFLNSSLPSPGAENTANSYLGGSSGSGRSSSELEVEEVVVDGGETGR